MRFFFFRKEASKSYKPLFPVIYGMENKKLGGLLIAISVLMLGTFFYYGSALQKEGNKLGCYPSQDCLGIEKNLAFSHILIGIGAFILALGVYLIFFNKTEQAILAKLEQEKKEKVDNAMFSVLLKALDPYEQKVVQAIREQQGITQNTLRIRLEMSKAKLSYVLQELERRGIIKRVEKGKTLAIYLRV